MTRRFACAYFALLLVWPVVVQGCARGKEAEGGGPVKSHFGRETEQPNCASPQLTLTEQQAFRLPDGNWSPNSIAFDGRSLAVGDRANPVVWVHRPAAQPRRIDLPGADVVAVGFSGSGVLEVVDRTSRQVLTISDSGKLLSSRALYGVEGDIEEAQLDDGKWYIGARSGSDYQVYALEQSSITLVGRIKGTIGEVSSPMWARLSVFADTVTITRRAWPFSVSRFHKGHQSGVFSLTTRDSAGLSDWVALPALRLSCAFLITLSHLRSPSRRLLLLRDDGSLIREARLEAPIGFVASEMDSVVIAVRKVADWEVVVYNWTLEQ